MRARPGSLCYVCVHAPPSVNTLMYFNSRRCNRFQSQNLPHSFQARSRFAHTPLSRRPREARWRRRSAFTRSLYRLPAEVRDLRVLLLGDEEKTVDHPTPDEVFLLEVR